MDAIPMDTTIEAVRKQYEILRSLSPEVRLQMAFQASDSLRNIVKAGVKLRHPDYDQQQVNREVVRLMIGDSLFKQMNLAF